MPVDLLLRHMLQDVLGHGASTVFAAIEERVAHVPLRVQTINVRVVGLVGLNGEHLKGIIGGEVLDYALQVFILTAMIDNVS